MTQIHYLRPLEGVWGNRTDQTPGDDFADRPGWGADHGRTDCWKAEPDPGYVASGSRHIDDGRIFGCPSPGGIFLCREDGQPAVYGACPKAEGEGL